MGKHCGWGRKGFTLIELIVVIAILAILAAVAIPRFPGFVEAARIAVDKSVAKSMATVVYAGKAQGSELPEDEIVKEHYRGEVPSPMKRGENAFGFAYDPGVGSLVVYYQNSGITVYPLYGGMMDSGGSGGSPEVPEDPEEPAGPTDQQRLEQALAGVAPGSITYTDTNAKLAVPAAGEDGVVFRFYGVSSSSQASITLGGDGMTAVITQRPPGGSTRTLTLTLRATVGEVEQDVRFSVTIPASGAPTITRLD
ncbi:prepilin-type N-terminal cleavage/methylation domain-containing protein [Anaerotalea alkaliphila]|uniref:prepilin-type N-terminal cleavage/methylation domain-containing protein n=1 Tax=Anaerotalea alkaliphila TaxID=2662126 RepID=UPI001FEA2C06|nr:prepilin-type N-terminal cleavage/methylation domain-containing protein [Anaerotalea alkaliphila]